MGRTSASAAGALRWRFAVPCAAFRRAGASSPNTVVAQTKRDVWERVAHYESGHGRSRTSSLVEVQRGLDRQVENIVREARPLPAQRGVLIGVAGHPVLLEVFDHPQTLAEQWDAILSAVAVDALLVPAEPTPGYRARAFARRTLATAVAESGLAGVAMAIAGNDRDLISARGLATSDRVIYAGVVNTRHQLVLAA